MKTLVTLTLFSLITLTGCTGNGQSADGPDAAKPTEENAVVHASTPMDAVAVRDTTPITADKVRLYINGMGCPQCVSNIDIQLARMDGVKASRVNLGNGTVEVEFEGPKRPSPARIAKAVSGDFTLVKIEEVR